MGNVTETVSVPLSEGQMEGYLARPEGDGLFPGVVVIHEAFGLNENIKDITRRFANKGYAALAVDLFRGRNKVMCMFRFIRAMRSAPFEHEGIQHLKASLTFLGEQPFADANRIGAVGYCLGGGLAIAWACADDRLKVIAPYYGVNPPLEAVKRSCPVVGSYPGNDFTTKAGGKLDQALAQYNIPHDIKIYPGAKHSFFNDTSRNHNADAAQDSWQRVLAFFNTYLVEQKRAAND
jgi:carboxymethylenebutenolidase